MRLSFIPALSCLAFSIAARAQPAGITGGEAMAWQIIADVVRITATSANGASSEQGFGFVVGERQGSLYIATADHVVRQDNGDPFGKISITFYDEQAHPQTGSLIGLRVPPKLGDLAVLELPKPRQFVPSWPPQAGVHDISAGTRAWRIGKQQRWVPAASPGEFLELQQTIWLGFDNLDTPPGSSGGPIVTDRGIIGMVVAEGGELAPARVLPIDTIETEFRQWRLPWNLGPPALQPPPPQAVSATVQPAPQTSAFREETRRPQAPVADAWARNFVVHYYAGLSDDADTLLRRLRTVISDPVTFFGKSLTFSQYAALQSAYFKRWPYRRFSARPETLQIHCDEQYATCDVTGVIDYDVRNPYTVRSSQGSEAIHLRLRETGNAFTILLQGKP